MSGIGDSIDALTWMFLVLLVVFLPLGAWKAIEIAIWILHHIHMGTAK